MVRHLFEPARDDVRHVHAVLSAAAGIAGVALAAYIIGFETGRGRLITAAIAGSTGLFSLIIAKRLFTNRTSHKSGALVSPWLMLTVGVALIVVGVGNVWFGDIEAGWLIFSGGAAAVFAWRKLRQSHDSPAPPNGA